MWTSGCVVWVGVGFHYVYTRRLRMSASEAPRRKCRCVACRPTRWVELQHRAHYAYHLGPTLPPLPSNWLAHILFYITYILHIYNNTWTAVLYIIQNFFLFKTVDAFRTASFNEWLWNFYYTGTLNMTFPIFFCFSPLAKIILSAPRPENIGNVQLNKHKLSSVLLKCTLGIYSVCLCDFKRLHLYSSFENCWGKFYWK